MVRKFTMGIVTMLLAFSAAKPLKADTTSEHRVKVTIPFVFYAGSKAMPAGEYMVTVNTSRGLIMLEPKGDSPLSLTTVPKQTTDLSMRGRLIFEQNGSNFLLTEVWTPSSSVGQILIYKNNVHRDNRFKHKLQIETR